MSSGKSTPLMQQFFEIKGQYPDTLLFFQVGDFYELFFEDAQKAASFLGITLTSRGKNNGEPIPLCGVPVHAKDHYIAKLVNGGFKVAICDQLEQAIAGKVVKRGVTRVLTPGMLTDDVLLDKKSASYLLSFFPTKDGIGLLFSELLTAQLFATVLPRNTTSSITTELSRFFPDEIVIPHLKEYRSFTTLFKRLGYFSSVVDALSDDREGQAQLWANKQFDQKVLNHFADHFPLQMALYYFYSYVEKHNTDVLSQFTTCTFYEPDEFLHLDASAKRNLELVKNMRDGTRKHTVLSVIDNAYTVMGSRMIRKWLLRPLVDLTMIMQRQDVVALFVKDSLFIDQLGKLLCSIGDLERIVGRIALSRAHHVDYVGLSLALGVVKKIQSLFVRYRLNTVALLQLIIRHCSGFEPLHEYMSSAINDDISRDWIIKSGFDSELDRLRSYAYSSKQQLMQLEKREQEKTGIQSLKVRYNQVHGYYIEVTKANSSLVPDHYVRTQTLVGKERFTTMELRRLAQEIDQATQRIDEVEQRTFDRVKQTIAKEIASLRKLAHALATLDALIGFARGALYNNYVRPLFNDQRQFNIKGARHLVVEHALSDSFVPNDILLNDKQSTLIITGPNMGGKSTYLRQTALISILSQIGSFAPAKRVDVPLVDAIFTRIGAGDHLAEGKSTFLVEMEETAEICRNATKDSLVILDEVGRGTSTFDGLAIAQAVVEYLHNVINARCLFATHYHELTRLHEKFPAIVNYYAASKRVDGSVVFLHKLLPGVADESFGIHVGKLAGLPVNVVKQAQHMVYLLRRKEANASDSISFYVPASNTEKKDKKYDEVVQLISDVDIEDVSPRQAFDLLWRLREKIRNIR